jgi:CRP-like cAMP-binding protein
MAKMPEIGRHSFSHGPFFPGLVEFISGDLETVNSDEFMENFICLFTADNFPADLELKKIFPALQIAVLCEDIGIRQRILQVLHQAAEYLLSSNSAAYIPTVSLLLARWLRFETERPAAAEVIFRDMQKCTSWLIKNGCLAEARHLTMLLAEVVSGRIQKNSVLKELAGRSLEAVASDDILLVVITGCLEGGEKCHFYKNIAVTLTPASIIFILERGAKSTSSKEHRILRNLVASCGDEAVDHLIMYLQKKPSPLVVRDIMYILGEIGSSESYQYIAEYHDYPDEKVQLETIFSIIKIDQQQSWERLVNALYIVSERLKLHILRLLIEMGGSQERLYKALEGLAARRSTLSISEGGKVLSYLLTALQRFPREETVKLLLEMKNDYRHGSPADEIVVLIDQALGTIGPKIRHSGQRSQADDDGVAYADAPAWQETAEDIVNAVELKVKQYLADGDKKAAADHLREQAMVAINEGDLAAAELLRDRFAELAPFAQKELLEMEDLIGNLSAGGASPKVLALWESLSRAVGRAEFALLFQLAQKENYQKGEIVIKSGETDNCLLFLNSGSLGMSCNSGEQEVFLRRLKPGEIVGCDYFFSVSIWTITLKALSRVQLLMIDQHIWAEMLAQFPGFEENLRGYCQRFASVAELIRMSNDERRRVSRYPAQLATHHTLLGPFGRKGKRRFRGMLIDISATGLAFQAKLASRKISGTLLGRQVISTLQLPDSVDCELRGLVVAVKLKDEGQGVYSVHVRLVDGLADTLLKNIIDHAHRQKVDRLCSTATSQNPSV